MVRETIRMILPEQVDEPGFWFEFSTGLTLIREFSALEKSEQLLIIAEVTTSMQRSPEGTPRWERGSMLRQFLGWISYGTDYGLLDHCVATLQEVESASASVEISGMQIRAWVRLMEATLTDPNGPVGIIVIPF